MRSGIVGTVGHNGVVKVFVSSLISGYEVFRAAVFEALETLDHRILRAEDFSALPGTPQQACLAAVRDSDVVILLLGERYGYVQPSGLSATHEEYREARERKPVFVFVENVSPREDRQEAFLAEVRDWSTGHFTASYSTPDDLKTAVLRGLHHHELATSAGPVDETEIQGRAIAALPSEQNSSWGGRPRLNVVIAAGPYQQVLRPGDLDRPDFASAIQREAFFGDYPVLDTRAGTSTSVRGNSLVLEQDTGSISVDLAGSILISQPAARDGDRHRSGLPALIEEDVIDAIERAGQFSGWLLDHIDPVRRLSDVVPAARITDASYMAWRTRADYTANPNTSTISMGDDDHTATLTPARRHRQALSHDARRIAEDLAALLRRARQR